MKPLPQNESEIPGCKAMPSKSLSHLVGGTRRELTSGENWEMIPPIHIRIPIILGLGFAAVFIVAVCNSNFLSKKNKQMQAMTASGNCQTDVLAPFIQNYKLAHIPPAESESFQEYVFKQVKANIVPEDEALETLAQIQAVGEGEPIHTARGWVMPAIHAQN